MIKINKLSLPSINSNHQINQNMALPITVQLDQTDSFTTKVSVGNHQFIADEPVDEGGKDEGPSPYELLTASLASCTAMTIQMYARRKEWDLKSVKIDIQHRKIDRKIDVFEKNISFVGDLNEEQKKRLLQIADKCPVHKTLLHNEVRIETKSI